MGNWSEIMNENGYSYCKKNGRDDLHNQRLEGVEFPKNIFQN